MKLPVAFPFAVPTKTLAVLVLGASLGGLPHVARSQTTPNINTPAAPNITAADNAGQTNQAFANNGVYALTPGRGDGNARPSRQNMMERRMRDVMARNGITTTSTQDAILTFLREDEDGKRPVRDASRRLWNGMRRDVPIERVRALLSDYQKTVETQRQNRQKAQTALDARVGYSLDPRLESMLWLLGVLGEGQNVLSIPMPQPGPSSRGPRIAAAAGNQPGIQFYGMPTPTSQLQVEGVVNAKNSANEGMVWLEIRDGNGRLWRMVPSTNPDAQPILNRQIGGLVVGTHVLVRLVSPPVMTPTTPYSLVALAPATNGDDGEANADEDEGGDQGAGDAPDGQ